MRRRRGQAAVPLLCREDDMYTSRLDTVTDRLRAEARVEEDRHCSDAEGAIVQSGEGRDVVHHDGHPIAGPDTVGEEAAADM